MKAWMTYNANCGTARNVLALLREHGIEPEIREYLKHPLTHAELAALVKEMAVPAREIVRWKEKDTVAAAGIGEDTDEAALLDAMVAHPVLLNRPIVRTAKGMKLCRPSEAATVLI